MKTIKKILSTIPLVFLLSLIGNVANAVDEKTGMTNTVKSTISHLEEALGAVNANDFDSAKTHLKAARQVSKAIIGGTLAPTASQGSNKIVTALNHSKQGNKEDAVESIKEALNVFNSILTHTASQDKSQGGLY